MPAGDVFGLDGFFLNKSNPIVVSTANINSTAAGAGITVVSGVLDTAAGIATLTFSTAAGLSTTPFYTGAKIAVSGLGTAGVAHTGYNGTFVVAGFAGTTTVSYATTGYVGNVTAGITTTGRVVLLTDTAVTNTTWSSGATHGWFGGGDSENGGGISESTVDRIDFSNDTSTASVRGPLSSERDTLAATGNSNYGWFGGGNTPTGIRSTVDRIDFSNDSATASLRGPLSFARYALASTGNSNYGWFGGGTLGPTKVSKVDRIDFSNDSGTASTRGPLSLARQGLVATGNSNYGWFGGGVSPTVFLSSVERINFSNDSITASIRGPLSSTRNKFAATGNSNYGWFAGNGTITNRIDFSNDSSTASVRGPLNAALGYAGLSATGNSNYGWFGGGYYSFSFDPPEYAAVASVERIDFSNDSATASVRRPLYSARSGSGATSGQAKGPSIKLKKAGNYGWFGGGYAFSGVDPVEYSYYNLVNRIDFSNDTGTAPIRTLLSSARYGLAATGNSNYGWFGGGSPGASKGDGIDF